jgi:predicted TIM-barrel fold metal-dependent hydrolase
MQRYSLHDERVVRVAAMLASFASGPAPPLHPAVPDRKTSAGWSDPGAPAQSDAGPPAAAGDMATARSAAPVLFVHCGVLSVGARRKLGLASPFDMSRGNPLHLHTLALRFPTLPIVIPHFGAGMLREALMLADVCPNVYFDTSSSNSWMRYTPGLTLERVFATALEVVGPARLLFGTDSSFFPRGWHRGVYEQQRAALTRIGASEHDQDQIFGGNFKRLHGGAGT